MAAQARGEAVRAPWPSPAQRHFRAAREDRAGPFPLQDEPRLSLIHIFVVGRVLLQHGEDGVVDIGNALHQFIHGQKRPEGLVAEVPDFVLMLSVELFHHEVHLLIPGDVGAELDAGALGEGAEGDLSLIHI